MYKFVDTNEVSEGTLLPSEALKINGEYIENIITGYRTLTVSGREALPPELSTYETGTRNGSRIKSKRYPARTIRVQYQLIAEDNAAFRSAFNKLAQVLDVEDAELIFEDEPDKFFIGTPSVIGEVEAGRNSVIGEFELFCADPFKYSVTEYEVEAESVEITDAEGNTFTTKMFNVDYGGTYKAFPTFETEFYKISEDETTTITNAGDCGYFALINDKGKILQVGDEKEIDGIEHEPSQTLIAHNSFNASALALWDITGSGGATLTTSNGAVVPSYGTVNGTTSMLRSVPADTSGVVGAENFRLTFTNQTYNTTAAAYKNARGRFSVALFATELGLIAGVEVEVVGISRVNVNFLVGSSIPRKTVSVPIDTFANSSQVSSIQKIGDTVEFNIASGAASYSYTLPEIAEKAAGKIQFHFENNSTDLSNLASNQLNEVKLIKDNCTEFVDVPNKFTANDVAEIDCRKAEIYVNGMKADKYGALGNDWEDFYLHAGENLINVSYSSWITEEYAPTFKMRYREVFL